jgi:hypothetical protein
MLIYSFYKLIYKHLHPVFLETSFYKLLLKTRFYKNSMDTIRSLFVLVAIPIRLTVTDNGENSQKLLDAGHVSE